MALSLSLALLNVPDSGRGIHLNLAVPLPQQILYGIEILLMHGQMLAEFGPAIKPMLISR